MGRHQRKAARHRSRLVFGLQRRRSATGISRWRQDVCLEVHRRQRMPTPASRTCGQRRLLESIQRARQPGLQRRRTLAGRRELRRHSLVGHYKLATGWLSADRSSIRNQFFSAPGKELITVTPPGTECLADHRRSQWFERRVLADHGDCHLPLVGTGTTAPARAVTAGCWPSPIPRVAKSLLPSQEPLINKW